ncbi:spermidine synthase [Advenella faeciporci]|uniref:Spermidine synthase n=1 Tax=Advenella faeciporci TaxID=797535 RepID=A0A918JF76_9BURK|nr:MULTISPECIES: spermidine synthase [Advenella]WKU18335.1 spermidine synthase [Advenella alkanexedens]GGW77748.1 spermidine synthase [Advenella faeciporci]
MASRKLEPHPVHDAPAMSEQDGIRYLHFDSVWMQGAMQVSKPSHLVFEYTEQMMAWLLFLSPPKDKSIGILGLGAGALTRFCLRHTQSQVITVEWNPMVTAICQSYFRLGHHKRHSMIHDDAHEWVTDPLNHDSCAVLMVDLYDYTAQGPVCNSLLFYQGCRRVLGDLGIAVINLFGHHPSFHSNIRNINKAFANRVIMFPETEDGNRIVLAFTGPPLEIEEEVLAARAADVERRYGLPATKWIRALSGEPQTDGLLRF